MKILFRAVLGIACGTILGSTVLPVASAGPPEPGPSQQSSALGLRRGTQVATAASHRRTVAYWTNRRVLKVQSRDYRYLPRSKRFRLFRAPRSQRATIGSTWTAGGAVERATGKILFTMGSSDYVCSGSVVAEPATNRSVVLTAAHCVFDQEHHRFARNWMFVPDYARSPAPMNTNREFCKSTAYGCWTATALLAHRGFTSERSFNDRASLHDFAFAVVGSGGLSGTRQLDQTVGAQPISFAQWPSGAATSLFGYPAAGKYNGNQLTYCHGPLGLDGRNRSRTYSVACDMTAGSSGGPWFSGFTAGKGTLISVNSYGYDGVDAMQGPVLNDDTRKLFLAAQSASRNRTVS